MPCAAARKKRPVARKASISFADDIHDHSEPSAAAPSEDEPAAAAADEEEEEEEATTQTPAARKAKKRSLVSNVVKEKKDEDEPEPEEELTEDTLIEAGKGFLSYAFFLLVFSVITFTTRSSNDFWANEAMKGLLVENEFHFGDIPHEKKLEDVHTFDQFFYWLKHPFLEAIFTPETGGDPLFLHGYNRLIGPVRLRQVRVMADSCDVPAMFATLIDRCYAPYAATLHDDQPFGPPDRKWLHQTMAQLDGDTHNGEYAQYGGGGFVVDLPSNATAAALALEQLEQDGFVDRATRAVFVDLSAYNANVGMFYSARILFEFLPSGGVMPSPTLRVLRPLLYTTTIDFVRAFFEVIFVLYVLVFIVQESREIRRASDREGGMRAYFGDKWNLLDWCNILLFLVVIALRLYVFAHTNEMLTLIAGMEPDDYINLQPLMFQLQQVQNLSAVNCFILFVKVFKYVAVIPQMNLLFATLAVAGIDLLFFSVVFLVIIMGFAMSFYMAFGLHVAGYSSVATSLLSLFQLVLGIFDYDELYKANRVLAPLLFCFFTVLVIFVLMNIFLAIINDAFMLVNEQQRSQKNVATMVKNLFYKKVMRKQISDLISDLGDINLHGGIDALVKGVDMDGDNALDTGELEMMLRKTKLSDHFTVKELLRRFDESGDGVLSGAEVLKMNDLLLRKRREVDLQLAAQLSPRTRAHVRSIFETHDADQQGSLDTTELRAAVEEMGHQPSDAQLQSLLTEFDFDGSGELDPLEFTALMARMLGYKELPSEQMDLLRKVFDYVDLDGNGAISQAELAVVVDKFGLKLSSEQLHEYLGEFDTDGDGEISRVEFCSLMAKLQGMVGITANPNMVTKDLQMTVRKLEGLVAANEQRAQRALAALLKEAQVPCVCSASATAAPSSPATPLPAPSAGGGAAARGGGGAAPPPPGSGGLLPPADDDGAAVSRRGGGRSRTRGHNSSPSRARGPRAAPTKSGPGKLFKGAGLSVMGANAVVRVFGGHTADDDDDEDLKVSSSAVDSTVARAGTQGGGGGGGESPPASRTPESLIC